MVIPVGLSSSVVMRSREGGGEAVGGVMIYDRQDSWEVHLPSLHLVTAIHLLNTMAATRLVSPLNNPLCVVLIPSFYNS